MSILVVVLATNSYFGKINTGFIGPSQWCTSLDSTNLPGLSKVIAPAKRFRTHYWVVLPTNNGGLLVPKELHGAFVSNRIPPKINQTSSRHQGEQ